MQSLSSIVTCLGCSVMFGALALAADGPDSAALDRHRKHPGRQIRAHGPVAASLIDRLRPMPTMAFEYLLADSALNRFPTTARTHVLDDRERAVVQATLSGLPPEVRAFAERYVAAIYVVDDLGSSAWTEYLDPPGRQSFMVFDASVLRERPNAWATRKESSAFVESAAVRLEIAEGKENLAGGAFRFIFLHELGHAIAYGRRMHPTWVDNAGEDFPYLKLTIGKYPLIQSVPFYAPRDKRLSPAQALQIYNRWSVSESPTLYATMSIEEDFAECFASYVHVQILQQPYRLFVGEEQYENGILQTRCANRRDFFAMLLQNHRRGP